MATSTALIWGGLALPGRSGMWPGASLGVGRFEQEGRWKDGSCAFVSKGFLRSCRHRTLRAQEGADPSRLAVDRGIRESRSRVPCHEAGRFLEEKVAPLALKLGAGLPVVAAFFEEVDGAGAGKSLRRARTVLARWLFSSEASRRVFQTLWRHLYNTFAWSYHVLLCIVFLALGALVTFVGCRCCHGS